MELHITDKGSYCVGTVSYNVTKLSTTPPHEQKPSSHAPQPLFFIKQANGIAIQDAIRRPPAFPVLPTSTVYIEISEYCTKPPVPRCSLESLT